MQTLGIDVKIAESVDEVMRLAAPCSSDEQTMTAVTCAAGFNTTSVFVFTEISMLDLMVARATAGAVRALPYGLFAKLMPQDEFFKRTASENDVAHTYHTSVAQLFALPSIKLQPLVWPGVLSSEAEHATWIAYAAIDAWLNIVPFPYVSQVLSVIDLFSSSSFAPSESNAVGRNGRTCNIAALYLDQSRHYIKTKADTQFVDSAWRFVDFAAVCLFSVRTFSFSHPSHERIRANYEEMVWKVVQVDRSPLPALHGCDKYGSRQSTYVHHQYRFEQVHSQGWSASRRLIWQSFRLVDSFELGCRRYRKKCNKMEWRVEIPFVCSAISLTHHAHRRTDRPHCEGSWSKGNQEFESRYMHRFDDFFCLQALMFYCR